MVPMPHFGIILALDDWNTLAERLKQAQVEFVMPPVVRFKDEPGEQWTMFFRDPSGNPLEVKGFADFASIYAK